MQPRKLNVCVARFPYGGNGGISSEHPDVGDWLLTTSPIIATDARIEKFNAIRLADTPITMTRNQAVLRAQDAGADVLVMIDSDMGPDCHLQSNPFKLDYYTNPLAKPFWQSSFDFLYKHYEQGPVAVCAPYCGPPPNECVYVFEWRQMQSNTAQKDFRLAMIERETAAKMTGIQPCAAQPTGLIMFDMRLFDLLEQPWFAYEYEDEGPACEHCGRKQPGPQARKASTEDVVLTRDVAMHAQLKLGYNPLYCNWDAWAAHHKSKAVGMPTTISMEDISDKFARAARAGHHRHDRLMFVGNEVVLGENEEVYVYEEPDPLELVNGHAQ